MSYCICIVSSLSCLIIESSCPEITTLYKVNEVLVKLVGYLCIKLSADLLGIALCVYGSDPEDAICFFFTALST